MIRRWIEDAGEKRDEFPRNHRAYQASENRTGNQAKEHLASEKREKLLPLGAKRCHDDKAPLPIEDAKTQDQPHGTGREDNGVAELEMRETAEIDRREARSDEPPGLGDVAYL